MNKVKAMGMNAQDLLVFKAFMSFMMAPLVLLTSIAAALAITS